MGSRDLAVFILQHIAPCSLQHSWSPATKACRMLAECFAAAASLNANHFDSLFWNEFVEQSYRVAPTTDAGYQRVRKLSFSFHYLRSRLATNNRLEIANHSRVGMRTHNRA